MSQNINILPTNEYLVVKIDRNSFSSNDTFNSFIFETLCDYFTVTKYETMSALNVVNAEILVI